MPHVDRSELLEVAKERFREDDYKTAEVLLQQVLLSNKKSPDVFHMLGTIYYDQGKFNKAIKAFQRALEIDPTFTDSSVGLSIILNDLGRYDEGQKVFEEAQKILDQRSQETDPYTEEKLALKHEELGQINRRLSAYEDIHDRPRNIPQVIQSLYFTSFLQPANTHSTGLPTRQPPIVATGVMIY